MLIKKYKVLRDTSEKEGFGWYYEADDECLGTEKSNLNTGDYTIENYEKEFIIERKRNTGEWYKNIFEKRFEEEFKRLEEFAHPFLICEFTMNDLINFPFNSGIPQKYWSKLRAKSQYLISAMNRYQMVYKTKFILAGDHGREMAKCLFRKVVELCK